MLKNKITSPTMELKMSGCFSVSRRESFRTLNTESRALASLSRARNIVIGTTMRRDSMVFVITGIIVVSMPRIFCKIGSPTIPVDTNDVHKAAMEVVSRSFLKIILCKKKVTAYMMISPAIVAHMKFG